MCGIAGIINLDGGAPERSRLEAMNAAMVSRGPDGAGYWQKGPVGLAHLRLAIIDLATGDQPMTSVNGEVVVVFNGEIYNFQEVRRTLETLGYQFRTTSDTEVLIHAWREWGSQMLSRLNGMFAFAIYDCQRQRVFLARDRLGVKPLYFYLNEKTLVFASEMQGMIASGLIPREIDPVALDLYLHYQYIPAPYTIYQNVHKLRPAEYLELELPSGKAAQKIYWSIATEREPQQAKRQEEWLEELDALLNDAVRIRLISDVPFGAFLSGGADSGIVVAMMASKLTEPVKTFSIGLEGQKDELPYARMVAEKYKTEHEEFKVSPEGLGMIPKLCPYFGEPFADSSAVPTWYVSRMARAKVKMVLTGDGGDEMFAGYRSYSYLADALQAGRAFANSANPSNHVAINETPLWKKLARKAKATAPGAFSFVKRAAQQANIQTPPIAAPVPWVEVYDVSMKHFSLEERKQLRGERGSFSQADYFVSQFPYPAADSVVSQAQFCDVNSYLPGDILAKVDRMSMANSLETRSPLLDYRIAELAFSMPTSIKLPEPLLDGSKNKFILKELASRYLGRDYVYRPKEGFGIPVSQWLREDKAGYLKDSLLSSASPVYDYLDKALCQKLIHEHIAGIIDSGAKLWNLLMLDGWLRVVHQETAAINK